MRNESITIEGLELGQSLLTQIRGVRNSAQGATYQKVQIEIAQKIISNERNTPANPLLQMLNSTDERFNGGSTNRARRAWIVSEPQVFIEKFGSQLGLTAEEEDAIMSIGLDEIMPIGHLNPTIDGKKLQLQVIETVEPDEYEAKNLARRAKQNGRGLFCLTKDKGQLIFSHTQIVMHEPQHVFLPFDLKPFEEAFAPGTAAHQMSVNGKVFTPEGDVNIVNRSVPVSNPALEEKAQEMMGETPGTGAGAQQSRETEEALVAGVDSRELQTTQRQEAGVAREAGRQSGGASRNEGQGGYDVPGNAPGHEGGESSEPSRTEQKFE